MAVGHSTPAHVELPDGRRLAWADRGGADGYPVIEFHGSPGGRRLYELVPDEQLAAADVRWISFDRPGIGASDRHPGRRVIDVASDVAALADHLHIDRFAVHGYSVGGPYAAACAQALTNRITALGLTASIIPNARRGVVREFGRSDLWYLALHVAPLATFAFASLRALGRIHAETALRAFLVGATAPERAALLGSDAGKRAIVSLLSATESGSRGLVDDLRVVLSDWGFDLRDIGVPTHIWQGDDDSLVPPHWADELQQLIPGAQTHRIAGEGHFLVAAHMGSILARLRVQSS